MSKLLLIALFAFFAICWASSYAENTNINFYFADILGGRDYDDDGGHHKTCGHQVDSDAACWAARAAEEDKWMNAIYTIDTSAESGIFNETLFMESVLAPNCNWTTYGVGNWSNFVLTYDYLRLAGPSSEILVITDFQDYEWGYPRISKCVPYTNGTRIMFHSFTLIWYPPLVPNFVGRASTRCNQRVEFDEQGRVLQMEWWLDPEGLEVFYQSLLVTSQNLTAVCEVIQTACTGPNQQYQSVQDCLTFLETLRFVDPDGIPRFTGYSAVCHAVHSQLAERDPNTHCPHTGMSKVDLFSTPCNDFP